LLQKGASNEPAQGTQTLQSPRAMPRSWDAFRPGGKELKGKTRPQKIYILSWHVKETLSSSA